MDAEVVIVGSGVAGALLAAELLARGCGNIVMLEAGARIKMRELGRWYDYLTTGRLPYEDCHDPVDATDAFVARSRVIGRGGSTIHWGGWCPRLKPEDFRLRSATGRGRDWPISYAELEPYYLDAEARLRVAGSFTEGHDPPRSGPYPLPGFPFTLLDGVFIRGFEAEGLTYGAMPIARNSRAVDGAPACQTIGTCKYCPLGARFSADQLLDRLERHADFELLSSSPATRVFYEGRRARAVEYRDGATGELRTVTAERVLLCAGALETPKLLLGSTDDRGRVPGGTSGHLGRHLSYHPMIVVKGAQPENPAHLQQELRFPTLCSRHLDSEAEQAAGKLFLFPSTRLPRLDVAALVADGRSLDEIDARARGRHEIQLEGFYEIVDDIDGAQIERGAGLDGFGLPRSQVRLSEPAVVRERGAALLARMERVVRAMGYEVVEARSLPPGGYHAMSTCRMSHAPRDGVVDGELRIHDLENAYICSNAVFPSSGAVNPTLTLAALALRLAEHLKPSPTVERP